jgi:hypothetical protein
MLVVSGLNWGEMLAVPTFAGSVESKRCVGSLLVMVIV